VQGKKQFQNSLLNIIPQAATAALAIAVVFALTVVLTPSAQAQKPATSVAWNEKVLHSFGGTDGSLPCSGLTGDAAGNLYGTTCAGGTYNDGTVFELKPTVGGGWTEKVLHNFNNNGADGYLPEAGLTFDAAGNLYGTTLMGGTYNYGTVFELIPSPNAAGGWTEKVLHNFNKNGADGYEPWASLIFDAVGNLYGTSGAGGTYNDGTVFRLRPTPGGGWTEQVLHSFNWNGTDGYEPFASLILDAAGNLYGMTFYGGHYGVGTVFELTPSPNAAGWTEQVLHSFNSNGEDGFYPWLDGLIFDATGNLYGTTYAGGAYYSCSSLGCGTVFELTPTGGGGWTEQVLHSFGNGTDGASPHAAGLIFDAAGNLYGTTYGGGSYSSCGSLGCGTVFELTPSGGGGWTEQVLHNFDWNGMDGIVPSAGLISDAAGNLYGTTVNGGTSDGGTVFELTRN